MRILINTIPLLTPLSGVGHYVINLINSMMALKREHEYFFFYGNRVSSELRNYQSEVYRLARVAFYSGILPQSAIYKLRRFSVRYLLSKDTYDIYHETNYFPPGSITLPTISTIYDLSVNLYPQYHPIERVRMFEKYFLTNLPYCRQIIAISNSTKNDLVRLTGYPEERITVSYPGYHSRFKVVGRASVSDYIKDRRLPRKYILYLGTLEPRKNIQLLLSAYSLLEKTLRERYHLVLAGGKGWNYEEIFRSVDKLGIRSSIVFLGYVRDDEAPLLYNGASLFIYPSFYEGFGLPPLEAMACGCPVISANTSSLPEVVGDQGVMVDPHDEYDLRDKMEMLLTDNKARTRLKEYGLMRAHMFSWETCARQTLEVYRKAVE
jgi:glycosyltransferase involved in cell wall biosynthesis